MIHESETKVYLTKNAIIGEGEDIVAKFRLWMDAVSVAEMLTAKRPGLRLYVTDHRPEDRGQEPSRWIYQGGKEVRDGEKK